MSSAETPISDLRREIDEVDTALHDLIMRRSELAARIGALKNGGAAPLGEAGAPLRVDAASFIRPGREASILRRLVARHHGPLQAAVVVNIWRELMSALLRLQAPFSVAVYAPEQWPGYWDLARDHFGSHTPATAHDSCSQVLSLVIDGHASVGVLPLPQQDDRDPWWRFLLRRDAPRIIARLPFGDGATQRGPAVEALAVGRVTPEETGRDRSFFVLETTAEISRSALHSALKAALLEPLLVHVSRDPRDPATWLHLIEVEGYVRPDDARLARLAERRAEILRQIWPLGGYAVPFTKAELGIAEKA